MPEVARKFDEPSTLPSAAGDSQAIQHLEEAIASGKHWYIALLEAMGLWSSAEETYNGRHYRYLIWGEAFDWLVLAERLCETAGDLLPEDEKCDLLFSGKAPIKLTEEQFKTLLGNAKYKAYLNYLYGVTVEEALILAIEEEVYKARQSSTQNNHCCLEEAYQRIYGATEEELLRRFKTEGGCPHGDTITLTELKEFTYWLFKYRLKNCDKARIASDTKKGLRQLQRLRLCAASRREKPEEEPADVIELRP